VIFRFHPITRILFAGAVIWFVVAFHELVTQFIAWSNIPEGISREDFNLSYALYSVMDSLFMLGSAAMVEFLSRIYEQLKMSK
jgi:hypothetical protein